MGHEKIAWSWSPNSVTNNNKLQGVVRTASLGSSQNPSYDYSSCLYSPQHHLTHPHNEPHQHQHHYSLYPYLWQPSCSFLSLAGGRLMSVLISSQFPPSPQWAPPTPPQLSPVPSPVVAFLFFYPWQVEDSFFGTVFSKLSFFKWSPRSTYIEFGIVGTDNLDAVRDLVMVDTVPDASFIIIQLSQIVVSSLTA